MSNKQKVYLPLKRCLDFTMSLLALIIFSPLLIVVAFVIKLDSHGPVLFIQKRVGQHNESFDIYKFRTMTTSAPKNASSDTINADRWITKCGRILRKTSIDELPQFINILKGEMSLVGPRPALVNQNNLNKLRDERNIHMLKPGLTGLAQINGRDENDDLEKVTYDRLYLDQFSFITDTKCLGKTVSAVLFRKGIIEGK